MIDDAVVDKDHPEGISITYKSDIACGTDQVYGLKFEVMCNEDFREQITDEVKFVPASVTASDLTGCEKTV